MGSEVVWRLSLDEQRSGVVWNSDRQLSTRIEIRTVTLEDQVLVRGNGREWELSHVKTSRVGLILVGEKEPNVNLNICVSIPFVAIIGSLLSDGGVT